MNRKNISPIFRWAKEHGDANIYDRILLKILPQLLKENLTLSSDKIENLERIEVSDELYEITLKKTEELIGMKYV